MDHPRYHWLFLFALLCRLLVGEQALADMPRGMQAADCADHMLMPLQIEPPAALHASAQHHHAPGADTAPLAAADAAYDDATAQAHTSCDVHDCCPAGACDCACVHLTLLLFSSPAAQLMLGSATLATSRLQPAPLQPPERVFRPPA